MSAVERFEYHLAVKDDANAAIKQTGDNAASMAGNVNRVRSSFEGLGRDVKAFANRDMGNLGESLKAGRERLEKTSGALAALSGAFGQGESKIAKYGQAGVQLAATFAVGGPLLAGITAAGFAISALSSQAEENARAEGVWREQLVLTARTIREGTMKSVEGLRLEMVRLKEANEDYGKSSYEIAIKDAGIRKADLEGRLATIEKTERFRRAAVTEAETALAVAKRDRRGVDDAAERLEQARAIQGNAARGAQEYGEALKSIETTIWGIADAWAGNSENAKTAAAAARAAVAAATATPDGELAAGRQAIDLGAGREARRKRARKNAEKAARDEEVERGEREALAREAMREDFIATEQMKLSVMKEGWALRDRLREEELAKEKAFHDAGAQYAMQSTSIVAGAFNQLVQDRITGEEYASERFITSIMQQAGQVLVAEGVKLAGVATVSALTLNPLAIPQAAGAAGLIAGGVALGGVATGIMHTAAGGKIGQALPEEKRAAQTSKGTGSLGGSGSRQTGGGTTITIIYGGVSGPEAESGARALASGLQLANARGRITNRIERR